MHRRFPPQIKVERRPYKTVMRFRECDLVGSIGAGILAIPCMVGCFIWAHWIGWAITGAVVVVMATVHTRICVSRDVRSERRVLGIPIQRRRWSRALKLTWWHDWDLFYPDVCTIEEPNGELFELYLSSAKTDILQDEIRRALVRHAAGAYREA